MSHPVSHSGCTLTGMKQVEVWKWRVRALNGRVHVTRYRMTPEEARLRDPAAVRVEGSREVREVPETDAEVARSMPGTTMRSGLPARGWWRQPRPFIPERLR
jgi:hypothetical protein